MAKQILFDEDARHALKKGIDILAEAVKVGAGSEVEVKYLKSRVEDALSATRAAVEEVLVSGGGVALLDAVQALITGLPEKEKPAFPAMPEY